MRCRRMMPMRGLRFLLLISTGIYRWRGRSRFSSGTAERQEGCRAGEDLFGLVFAAILTIFFCFGVLHALVRTVQNFEVVCVTVKDLFHGELFIFQCI